MKFMNSGKYREITLSIALFIVFDAGVLMMNFYMANQFARDATSVNLAGRQRTLSQTTMKALLQTDNALGSGNYIDEPLAELKGAARLFDESLHAFESGGSVEGPDGTIVTVPPVETDHARRILAETHQVWTPFLEALGPVLAFDAKIELSAELTMTAEGAELEGDLFHAIMVGTENNTSAKLHDLMNNLTVHMEQESAQRAVRLRIIQVTGICLALINFFVILLHFIRNLKRSDARVAAAQRETGEILQTVNEGLFLLDSELKIGSQYSAALENILRRENLGGTSFVDVLRSIVPESTLSVARDYIGLFFGHRVNENLVDDLNPLDKLEVHFEDANGGFQTRHLGFEFRRVIVDGELSHLLATVNDITDKIELERELQESREKSQEQIDMLMDVLHIEPEILTDFLADAERRLAAVNAILRKPGRDASTYRTKLEGMFREVHTLKGEAGALGLSSVQSQAHELEDMVAEVRNNARASGTDFLPLTIKLDEILRHLNQIRDLVGKLVDFRAAMGRDARAAAGKPAAVRDHDAERRQAPRSDLPAMLTRLAERIAADHGKEVRLDCHSLDATGMPERYRAAVKDIAVQFVRNGVTHGIETPEQRLAVQKSRVGQVSLSFDQAVDGGYVLQYRDDGRGLCLERIKQVALDKGFVTADQIGKMEQRQIFGLIFRHGFSTSEKVTGDAGRGVGMDIIRNLVNTLGGKVRVSTSPGQYTSFSIRLPAVGDNVTQAA